MPFRHLLGNRARLAPHIFLFCSCRSTSSRSKCTQAQLLHRSHQPLATAGALQPTLPLQLPHKQLPLRIVRPPAP